MSSSTSSIQRRRPPLGDNYRAEVRIVVWQSDNVLKVPTGALFRRGERGRSFSSKATACASKT